MAKKKEPEKAPNHERWLLTYADMITLLMTFFIVLYALSIVDANKFHALSSSLKVALGVGASPDLISFQSEMMPQPVSAKKPANYDDTGENVELNNLTEVEAILNEYLKDKKLNDEVNVQMESKGLVVRLKDVMAFNPGEATIRPEAEEELKAIGQILLRVTNFIRVEGHTDNIPISGPKFSSNWQLSAARAANVVALLIEKSKISPQRFSAIGYAEYRPVANNSMYEGRTKNRRVDIVILKSKYNAIEYDK